MKKLLPDLLVILTFAVLSFAYFFPADIEDRILFQHDTAAGAGAGQEASLYRQETGEYTFGMKPLVRALLRAASLLTSEICAQVRSFRPKTLFVPQIAVSWTSFSSPGSKRTEVPEGMSR